MSKTRTTSRLFSISTENILTIPKKNKICGLMRQKVELSWKCLSCYIRRKSKFALQKNIFIPSVKLGGKSVMVLCCFTASGPGRLAMINGTMTSAIYQRNPEGEGQSICWCWNQLGFCSSTMILKKTGSPTLIGWRRTSQIWILLRWCCMSLKGSSVLENPPMCLNYNNSVQMCWSKFLHSWKTYNNLLYKQCIVMVAAISVPTTYHV